MSRFAPESPSLCCCSSSYHGLLFPVSTCAIALSLTRPLATPLAPCMTWRPKPKQCLLPGWLGNGSPRAGGGVHRAPSTPHLHSGEQKVGAASWPISCSDSASPGLQRRGHIQCHEPDQDTGRWVAPETKTSRPPVSPPRRRAFGPSRPDRRRITHDSVASRANTTQCARAPPPTSPGPASVGHYQGRRRGAGRTTQRREGAWISAASYAGFDCPDSSWLWNPEEG